MPTSPALFLPDYDQHVGLAAISVADTAQVWAATDPLPAETLLANPGELLVVFPSGSHLFEPIQSQADSAGFDCHELTPTADAASTWSVPNAVELLGRCARPRPFREIPFIEPPASLAQVTPAALALTVLSARTDLEGTLPIGRRERHPQWLLYRHTFQTAQQTLGFRVTDSSSKYRPDTCPRCHLRWDVIIDLHVGFEHLASYVWQCRNCRKIVESPMTSNRDVARR